jgi:toxin ParE1/3/4
MAKLILRQKAIDDLTDIWDYTALAWSENQADKYHKMIKTACKEIATDFEVGRSYNEINDGLFGYRVGKHIIFYQKVPNDEIEVIRILHERMDLKNRLTE